MFDVIRFTYFFFSKTNASSNLMSEKVSYQPFSSDVYAEHSVSSSSKIEQYSFGDVKIKFEKKEVWRNGVRLDLSDKEFQLLRYFVENRGKVISRGDLLRFVWGYHRLPNTRTVDVHVAWLRQKVDQQVNPQYILTIHGKGYKFSA
ncbi:MAG: winged helix-turn-helix domain-containing protein [Chloroherpetonaceae bacterium]|nr:winged helix-turn-helix domain-containing protein [Chloroherpetonaceae bacterium]